MIESVPNLSEGHRRESVEAAATAAAAAGAEWLDVHIDPDHGRSVVTLVGEGEGIVAGVLSLVRVALERIDLRLHTGAHPRIGAVDVIPFVPLCGATLADCDQIARFVGEEIAREHRIPVFLYAASASSPDRRALAALRRGGMEGLSRRMEAGDVRPDYGPTRLHPTAGAVAIGARPPLVAFNVILESDNLDVARRIAAEIRGSSGGLPGVQALGIRVASRGAVQVSMNLVDLRETRIPEVFDRVQAAAQRAGVEVRESEIVGLTPREALAGTTAERIRLCGRLDERILENRLARAGRECL